MLTRVPNRRTQVPKRVNGQVLKRTGPETSGTHVEEYVGTGLQNRKNIEHLPAKLGIKLHI